MKKILAVYSICGLSGRENTPYYIDSVRSLLNQTVAEKWGADFQVAVSGCVTSDGTQAALQSVFHDKISYNWFEEPIPLSVTVNATVDKCVDKFGEFEGYLYIDSGISFWDPSKRNDALEIFYSAFKRHQDGLVACMPSNDDGCSWWGINYEPNKDFVLPVGKATNMHCQIFPESWRKAYNRILPDIFASNCMESVFSCMAAAIHIPYVMTQDIHVLHAHSMDGASMSARNKIPGVHNPMSSMFQTSGDLFMTTKTMDDRYMEGHEYGFGFEECTEYWRHDPSKFENGKSLDPRLKEFVARELYLKAEEYNYADVRQTFTPARV